MSLKHIRFLELLTQLQQRFNEGKEVDFGQLELLATKGKVPLEITMVGYDKLFTILEITTVSEMEVTALQVGFSIVKGTDLIQMLEEKYIRFPDLSDEVTKVFEEYVEVSLVDKASKKSVGKRQKMLNPKIFVLCADSDDKSYLLHYYIPKSYENKRKGFHVYARTWRSDSRIPYSFSEKSVILVVKKKE